jgi:hypothetical protein
MPSIPCPQCGQQNDGERAGGTCWLCGQPLVLMSLDPPEGVVAGLPSQPPASAEAPALQLPQYVAGEHPALDIGLARLGVTEEEVRAFVGAGASYYISCWKAAIANKGRPRGFNLAACLFAGIWLPYRKLYVVTGLFFAGLIVLALLQRFYFLSMLELAEVPSWFIVVTAVGLAALVGARANTWYWNKAQDLIWQVRQQALSAEEHYRELRRRGGRSVAAVVAVSLAGVAGVVGAHLLLDQWPIFDEVARMERAVRQGMERDQKIQVAECRLRRQRDGTIKGTLTEAGGDQWDILRAWREGREVKWYFAEPVRRLKTRLCDQVSERFKEFNDRVKAADVRKDPDGTFSGTIETEGGIVFDIKQTPPEVFPPQVYSQVNEKSFENYMKVVTRREGQPDLADVHLVKQDAGEWRGDATDRLGGRYNIVLRLRPRVGAGPADALGQSIEWELRPQGGIPAAPPPGWRQPWIRPGEGLRPGWRQPEQPFGPQPPFWPKGPLVPKGLIPIR